MASSHRQEHFQDSDAVIDMLRRHISGYDKSGTFLGPGFESYSEIQHAIKLFTDTK